MKTYMAVKSEIAKLEKQAEALRKSELKDVVTRIRAAIAEYGLTAADLGLGGKVGARKAGPRKTAGKRRAKQGSVGVAKYRDPATQQTWTGRGRPPAWIVSAKNRDDYLIAGTPAAPAKAPTKKRAAAKKKTARAKKMIKTPAVRIESGVASV